MRRRTSQRSNVEKKRSGFDRALAITLVSGLGLLMILGLVFSIAHGSQQITSRATDLHNADESLRAATVVRAQTGLAVHLLTIDDTFGQTNSEDAIALSLTEAGIALEDLRHGTDRLETAESVDAGVSVAAARAFADTSDRVIDLVASGDPTPAVEASLEQDREFQQLIANLEAVRDGLATSVAESDVFLGRVGTLARFLVAFLVPAAVIFIYRELLLRQHRQVDLESRLESERRLGRAREEFIANASHELRTPLTGITGLARILAEDPSIARNESASELLDLIISESDDLARMVEDLLTTARLDAGALQFDYDDVAIDEVVAEVVDPLIRNGQTVSTDCEPALVRVDGLRTRQILRNLLSNAQKYGGELIRVVGRVEGRTYRCEVIDDGAGVPDGLSDKIFERFVHQGSRGVADSVGLGLAIVHALAQGMGGSVTYGRADSETIFTVRLPLTDPSEVMPPIQWDPLASVEG